MYFISNLACINGSFGVGCIHKSSENCLNNETCENSAGGCRNCAPGREGDLCNKSKNMVYIDTESKKAY